MDYLTTPVKQAENSVNSFLLDPDLPSQLFQRHWPLIELHLDLLHKPLGQRFSHIN
jgi:hypothetical protein